MNVDASNTHPGGLTSQSEQTHAQTQAQTHAQTHPQTHAQMHAMGRHRARFTLEPLARGAGFSLGSVLQRVLLSSRPGGGPTLMAGAGAGHQQAARARLCVDVVVEPMRGVQGSEPERLRLDIETDGSIAPDEALRQGARLLMDELQPFTVFTEESPWTWPPAWQVRAAAARAQDLAGLMRDIADLDLSVRSVSGLRAGNMHLVGELIQRTETDLLRTPYLGRKGVFEVRHALAACGLVLGTVLRDWPPTGSGRSC